jgi:hypothetical protein
MRLRQEADVGCSVPEEEGGRREVLGVAGTAVGGGWDVEMQRKKIKEHLLVNRSCSTLG